MSVTISWNLELNNTIIVLPLFKMKRREKKVENVSKELLFIILTENHVIAFACLFSFENSLILHFVYVFTLTWRRLKKFEVFISLVWLIFFIRRTLSKNAPHLVVQYQKVKSVKLKHPIWKYIKEHSE